MKGKKEKKLIVASLTTAIAFAMSICSFASEENIQVTDGLDGEWCVSVLSYYPDSKVILDDEGNYHILSVSGEDNEEAVIHPDGTAEHEEEEFIFDISHYDEAALIYSNNEGNSGMGMILPYGESEYAFYNNGGWSSFLQHRVAAGPERPSRS